MLFLKSLIRLSTKYLPVITIITVDLAYGVYTYLWSMGNTWDIPGQLYQTFSPFLSLQDSIYNFKFFLGYYPVLYPSLVHTFIKLISFLLPFISIVWIYFGVLAIIRISFWIILFKTFKKYKSPFWAYVLICFLFIFSSIGFINLNSWQAGTITSSLGFAIFIFQLYRLPSYNFSKIYAWLEVGAILGFALISHTITASVLVILWLIILANLIFFEKGYSKSYLFKVSLYSIFTAFCIGAIWVIPYLNLNRFIPRSSIAGYFDLSSVFSSAILIFLILSVRLKTLDIKILSVLSLVLIFLGIFPYPVNELGLHFNRYYYYALLVIFLIAFKNLSLILKRNRISYIAVPVVCFLLLLSPIRREVEYYKNHLKISLNSDYTIPEGRFVDATKYYFFPHFLDSNFAKNENVVSLSGLFVENSPNALSALAVKSAINSDSFFPLFSQGYKKQFQKPSPETLSQKLHLFGINTVFFGEVDLRNAEKLTGYEVSPIQVGKFYLNRDGGLKSQNIYAFERKEKTALVEVLNYTPPYSPEKNLFSEWSNLNIDNLYSTDSHISEIEPFEINKEAKIENIEVSDSYLKFYIDSKTPVPVLIKFAYSDLLKATADGNETEIYRVSPDFMMVIGRGEIIIETDTPVRFVLAKYLSIFTSFTTITVMVYVYTPRYLKKE